jgi:hypothetical protein
MGEPASKETGLNNHILESNVEGLTSAIVSTRVRMIPTASRARPSSSKRLPLWASTTFTAASRTACGGFWTSFVDTAWREDPAPLSFSGGKCQNRRDHLLIKRTASEVNLRINSQPFSKTCISASSKEGGINMKGHLNRKESCTSVWA